MTDINLSDPKATAQAQLNLVANAIESVKAEKPIDSMAVLRQQAREDKLKK